MKNKKNKNVIDQQIIMYENTIKNAKACKEVDDSCSISRIKDIKNKCNIIYSDNHYIFQNVISFEVKFRQNYNGITILLNMYYEFEKDNVKYKIYSKPYLTWIGLITSELRLADLQISKIFSKIKNKDLEKLIIKECFIKYVDNCSKNNYKINVPKNSVYTDYFKNLLSLI